MVEIVTKQILGMTQTCHLRIVRAVDFCRQWSVHKRGGFLGTEISCSIIPVISDHLGGDIFVSNENHPSNDMLKDGN